MAESPAQSCAELVPQQAESDLASLVFAITGPLMHFNLAEMSQQVQMGMENMLKLVNEIDQNSVGIKEEIEKSKDYAMEKKRVLEEEKEQFQKAAYTILDMLSNRG
ncbi:hypothetical protein HID58_077269 [Brassica napus]|uniref:Uncharacterized protein n=1 Tax=Brassica napus TaxID=3708 RepID=A0ABQ7YQ58_BRANA|nr:hypothetical protein HID58_077269 [Brassica napus]